MGRGEGSFIHLQREGELLKVLRAPSLLESILLQKHSPLEEHRIPKPVVSSFVKVFSQSKPRKEGTLAIL